MALPNQNPGRGARTRSSRPVEALVQAIAGAAAANARAPRAPELEGDGAAAAFQLLVWHMGPLLPRLDARPLDRRGQRTLREELLPLILPALPVLPVAHLPRRRRPFPLFAPLRGHLHRFGQRVLTAVWAPVGGPVSCVRGHGVPLVAERPLHVRAEFSYVLGAGTSVLDGTNRETQQLEVRRNWAPRVPHGPVRPDEPPDGALVTLRARNSCGRALSAQPFQLGVSDARRL